MTAYFGIAIAMLTGVVGTSVIHLSKGIMKHGVGLLGTQEKGKLKASAVYTAGMLMNFTNPLWVIIANRFAPTVYYTSMYGLGLVVLLFFSRFALKEEVSRRQITGALLVVAGTILVGIGRIVNPASPMHLASRSTVFIIAGVWALATPIIALACSKSRLPLQELLFGVFGGGLASLEAVLKGVAQAGAEGSTFLPTSTANWWLFAVSFLGAAGAFGMIQWSYLRQCRVSMMATAYNIAYVALPLLVTVLAIPGEQLSLLPLAGLFFFAAGALVLR